MGKLKSPKKQASVRDVMRSVSRKITQVVDDDGNEDEKTKQQEQLGEERAQKKTQLSGLHCELVFLPEARGMTTFAWRCLSVSVQDYSCLRIHVQALRPQSCEAGTQHDPCTASAC